MLTNTFLLVGTEFETRVTTAGNGIVCPTAQVTATAFRILKTGICEAVALKGNVCQQQYEQISNKPTNDRALRSGEHARLWLLKSPKHG